MVYSFTASPFADAAQATQFAAVEAALRAAADTDALLLGNLVLTDDTAPIDAVLVCPHSITLLVLVPRGGRLSIPALGYGSWQLNGLPLPGHEDFDNPYEQVAQQKGALQSWLSRRFGPEQANLQFLTSLVLFGAPVMFAPDVEVALSSATAGFQLLSDPAELPRRLGQLASPEIDLTAEDLAEWAAEWTAFAAQPSAPVIPPMDSATTTAAASDKASGFLGKQARAIWGWLGAADVPDDDLPYGYGTTDVAARNEEKQQLEQLRQQMQADLRQQLQALEAREAERERSIGQLRAELAQAPTVASEATALVSRLSAETRAKAALEAEMEASKAESAARNQELDGKIQQLNQLIDQLSARSVPVVSPTVAVPAAQGAPIIAPPVAMPSVTGPVLPAAPGAGTVVAAPPVARFVPSAAAPAAAIPLAVAPAAAAASSVATGTPWRFEWPPQLRQLGQRALLLPRAGLLAAGADALALAVLLFARSGNEAPVPFQENGRWGYADASGKPVVAAQYAAASPFLAGQAVVAKDGAYGFVNEEGKEVVPLAYDALNPYAGGFARARVGDAYTFIDEKGQEFDHYYFNALDFAEGHAAVLDHRGWHYISGSTEPATAPLIFAEAYSFTDGLARVKLRDGYTYITSDYLADSSSGSKPFGRYTLATDFADGKARVTQGGRSFTIDNDGDEVK